MKNLSMILLVLLSLNATAKGWGIFKKKEKEPMVQELDLKVKADKAKQMLAEPEEDPAGPVRDSVQINQAQSYKLVIKAKSPLNLDQKTNIAKRHKLEKLELLSKIDDEYFRRVYITKTKTNNIKQKKKDLLHERAIENVEGVHAVELFNIFPNNGSVNVTKDPMVKYQWGHFNQKQVVLKEKSDLHNIRVEGERGIDVQWKDVQAKIDPAMKKDIVVAVIDTGVDLTHPDIKDNIYKKGVECKDGLIDMSPDARDRDGNGYVADCMGYDFTVPKNSAESRLPMDENGHGTHVAGIIAASKNNSLGISGFSNKIKIMPIKVLSNRSLGQSMTDRLTLAILYAAENGADVINMSLGWAKSLDTEYLRKAVQVAIRKNIAVVAAAGNNSSNDKIYPCAYNNIICVGALTNDGKLAKFSNHGGNVDVLAPGDSIMSLTSRAVMPEMFSIRGYDIKNGTSQASPYVAALAALLKGVNPDIMINELTARIFESTQEAPVDTDRDKRVLHGLIQMDKALGMRPVVSVKPTFKVMSDILYSMDRKRFGFRLPIKNYWLPSGEIRVKLSSNTKAIKFINTEFKLPPMKGNEVKLIQVAGDILDITNDSQFDLTVSLQEVKRKQIQNDDGTTSIEEEIVDRGSYNHRVPMARYLEGDPALMALPVVFNGSPKPLAIPKDGKIIALARPITDKFQLGAANDLYLKRAIVNNDDDENAEPVEEGIEIRLFTYQGNHFKEEENVVFVKEAIELLGVQKLDLNYDGKADILIRALNEKENGFQYVTYTLVNNDGSPLLGDKSTWIFNPSEILDNLKNAAFLKTEIEGLGAVATPIIIEDGLLPDADQKIDSWTKKDFSIRKRIYNLIPKVTDGKVELTTRVIDNPDYHEKLRMLLDIEWQTTMIYSQIMHQSKEDYDNSVVNILTSVGQGYNREYHQLTLTSKKKRTLRKMNTEYQRFEGFVLNPVIDLDQETPDYFAESSFVGFHSKTISEVIKMSKENNQIDREYNYVYRHDDNSDHIIGFLSNFKQDDEFISFFQTRNNIVMVKRDQAGNTQVSKKPVIRFSFLQGSIFNELYMPITKLNAAGELSPALYVDGTEITTNRVHILSEKDGELVSEIKNSILIPRNCAILSPSTFGAKKASAYNFICFNKDRQLEVQYLPLN